MEGKQKSSTYPDWYFPAYERLKELTALKPGWHEGGSGAINLQAIEYAKKVVDFLHACTMSILDEDKNRFKPYIYPMPSGGIRIEVPCEPAQSDGENYGIGIEINENGITYFGFDSTKGSESALALVDKWSGNMIKAFSKMVLEDVV